MLALCGYSLELFRTCEINNVTRQPVGLYFSSFFGMVVALEVEGGDSCVAGTESDILPDILASVGTRVRHGA